MYKGKRQLNNAKKYAVACGYKDADVQVYAMTKALNRVCKINNTTTAAPDLIFIILFQNRKWRLNKGSVRRH